MKVWVALGFHNSPGDERDPSVGWLCPLAAELLLEGSPLALRQGGPSCVINAW